MSETLRQVQGLVSRGLVRISDHGYEELAADGILTTDAVSGVAEAVVVEDYPSAFKGPSVLVLEKDSSGRPIHILWAIPAGLREPAVLVTAYRPDPSRWSGNFTKRTNRWKQQGRP